ncbi:MAG: hypothetical protein RI516_07945, partial [Spiribacter sp.]|nr:hypothetical protein [Spiribacter sp.]
LKTAAALRRYIVKAVALPRSALTMAGGNLIHHCLRTLKHIVIDLILLQHASDLRIIGLQPHRLVMLMRIMYLPQPALSVELLAMLKL